MEKTRDCQLFMTPNDEHLFCKTLREFNPNIYFLDTTPSLEADIEKRLFEDVSILDSKFFSIVNFDLINKEELQKNYKMYGDYYHFDCLGRAQMQFLRSHPDIYQKGCLQHGRIADSYHTEDEEEKKWKNKVYNILRKLGEKVYWYYSLPNGGKEINEKPQRNLVALRDAVMMYNGTKGNFMLNSVAKYVPKGITINDLMSQ